MEAHNNRHIVTASAEKHPLPTAAVSLILYFAAIRLLQRYWTPFLSRILSLLGVRYWNAYLSLSLMMCALAGGLLLLCCVTGQVRIISQPHRSFGSGLISGGYIIFCSIVSILANSITAESFQPPDTVVFSIVYFILVGVSEELVFRGIAADLILRGLLRRRHGDAPLFAALLISGLLFALSHAGNMDHAAPAGVLVQMVGAFLIGMVITAVYFRTANIGVVIALHALNDIAAAFPVTVLSSEANISSLISGYGAAELWSLVPYIIVLAVLLRKSKREEIVQLWESLS